MKISRSKGDLVLNVLCLGLLVGIVLFLLVNWEQFPEKVPMHHDLAGRVDRWGDKSEMLILPGIAWGMFIWMSLIEQFPKIWNTGVKVTEENKIQVYRTLKNMIITMKFILVCMFSYLTVETAMGLKLSAWFLPVAVVLVFGNMIFWIRKLIRLN